MSARSGMSIRLICGAAVLALFAACSPTSRVHGFVPDQAELDDLLIGVDTKSTIADTIGTPADSGLREDRAWYYISSTVETFAFNAPEVVARQVIVFDFDRDGVLTNIGRYGLEDGRVVNLQTRVTPTDNRRTSILAQLLGNVGQISLPLPQ